MLKTRSRLTHCFFSHNDRYLISVAATQCVKIWNLRTGKCIKKIKCIVSDACISDKFLALAPGNLITIYDFDLKKNSQTVEEFLTFKPDNEEA